MSNCCVVDSGSLHVGDFGRGLARHELDARLQGRRSGVAPRSHSLRVDSIRLPGLVIK